MFKKCFRKCRPQTGSGGECRKKCFKLLRASIEVVIRLEARSTFFGTFPRHPIWGRHFPKNFSEPKWQFETSLYRTSARSQSQSSLAYTTARLPISEESFRKPNPIEGKNMNKNMAPKLSGLPCSEAFRVTFCPEFCSYFCLYAGAWVTCAFLKILNL